MIIDMAGLVLFSIILSIAIVALFLATTIAHVEDRSNMRWFYTISGYILIGLMSWWLVVILVDMSSIQ